MNHCTSCRSSIISRNAKRLGLLTTACLAALAVAAPAGATPSSSHISPGVGVARNHAHTHANPARPDQYRDTFAIHQLGTVVGADVHNRAVAVSAGCLPGSRCRSVALSFQIVTLAGTHVRLHATNIGRALNEHCPGCQTLADAYQFIVSTPRPFTLSAQAKGQLEAIHRQLDELRESREPISVIHERANSLAAEVKAILKREAAATPRAPRSTPRTHSNPP